jgi:hypothetical protein
MNHEECPYCGKCVACSPRKWMSHMECEPGGSPVLTFCVRLPGHATAFPLVCQEVGNC